MIGTKYLIINLLLIIPFIAQGQYDTIYYDNNWQKTTFDYADYYRVVHKESENSYKIEDHFLTRNRLQMTGYFSNLEKETKDGFFVFYNDKGFKTEQGNYKNNKQTGKWEHYYDSTGSIWHIDNYNEGEKDGELTSYYKDGKLKRREYHKLRDTSVTGKCYDEEGKEIHFSQFEKMPKANFDVQQFLAKNLKYPENARRKNIEGRTLTKFNVNEDGTISDIVAINNIGGGCNEEAIRVISKMPSKWSPAMQEGKPVKVYFTLPIVFKLE